MTSSDMEEDPDELLRPCCRNAGRRDLRGVAGRDGPEAMEDPYPLSPKDLSDVKESVDSSEYLLGRTGRSFSLSEETEDALDFPALYLALISARVGMPFLKPLSFSVT